MSCTVKHLENYTTEQTKTLFESDANNIVGVKLHAIIQLSCGYSTANLLNFTMLRINKYAEGID